LAEATLQEFYPDLVGLGVESTLEKGALLWREGDPGDSVVLLRSGKLEVLNETAEGQEVVLRTLDPGAVVGELAADGGGRSATVRACTPCRISRIPAAEFRGLLRRRPAVLEALYWVQVDRVRSLTRQVTRTHERAITDPLTRLYNFGFFRQRLEMEVDRARQTGDPVSLVLFDIDHFKKYNDAHGHEEGNVVLVTVAQILKGVGRRGDVLARYGGEEFVALLYGASLEEATHFGESVRRAVEVQPFKPRQGPLQRVTISGGCSAFPIDAESDEELIRAADANLYRAKEGGRNRVVCRP
jgi:diguanylate cyclase (GGDEF)-like protein